MAYIINYDDELEIIWIKKREIEKGNATVLLSAKSTFPLSSIVTFVNRVPKRKDTEEYNPVSGKYNALRALKAFKEFNSDPDIERDINVALEWLNE